MSRLCAWSCQNVSLRGRCSETSKCLTAKDKSEFWVDYWRFCQCIGYTRASILYPSVPAPQFLSSSVSVWNRFLLVTVLFLSDLGRECLGITERHFINVWLQLPVHGDVVETCIHGTNRNFSLQLLGWDDFVCRLLLFFVHWNPTCMAVVLRAHKIVFVLINPRMSSSLSANSDRASFRYLVIDWLLPVPYITLPYVLVIVAGSKDSFSWYDVSAHCHFWSDESSESSVRGKEGRQQAEGGVGTRGRDNETRNPSRTTKKFCNTAA